ILMINSSTGMTDTVWIVVRTSILGGSHAFLARLLKVTHQVTKQFDTDNWGASGPNFYKIIIGLLISKVDFKVDIHAKS
ncbi:MAG: hypothetical protein PUP46_10175, partial [Endozoicomonas sp. (ex Botrylloides leachii)]|nr:hypothetical protein [Endozoicomonas sp. (ex Botrylloides leachii)]